MQVLDLARTAVDIAREHGEPYGEIACDAVLRRGVPRKELEQAVLAMTSWPYVTRTRRAVDFADPGAATLAETLGRLLVAELGLGEVDTQFPIELEDDRVVWADMRIGRHLFEVDGKVKYTPVEAGGVATRPLTEVIWEEKKRERLIRRQGLGCLSHHLRRLLAATTGRSPHPSARRVRRHRVAVRPTSSPSASLATPPGSAGSGRREHAPGPALVTDCSDFFQAVPTT